MRSSSGNIEGGSQLLLLLDNVWENSLEAVQEFLELCPENVRVVLTSREASVVEALEGEIDRSVGTATGEGRERCCVSSAVAR